MAKLSVRAFQRIALALLVPAAAIVWSLSPGAIALLQPLHPDAPVAMAVLAVALTALVVTIAWAAVVLPLRARSDMKPLGRELAEIRAQGGFVEAVRVEQRKLDAMARYRDPVMQRRYHGLMAAAGLFLAGLGGLVTYVLWAEDRLGLVPPLFTVVALGLAGYHALRRLLAR